jgi:hypothetical protein
MFISPIPAWRRSTLKTLAFAIVDENLMMALSAGSKA